jgi:hypothetical protein
MRTATSRQASRVAGYSPVSMPRMGRDAAVTSFRPRYRRIGAAATSILVTLVAVLGAIGLIPVTSAAQQPPAPSDGGTASSGGGEESGGHPAIRLAEGETDTELPSESGDGRRIVFDIDAQRVWLVGQRDGEDVVRRTYLVSGSVSDNLKPGTYEVYSKSSHAVGIDDSGTMRYMVRFAHGANAAIGFHDIPVLDGQLVQSRDDLGTPQSHGCIRQWRPDARALWKFAPVGTTVVVV